MYYERNEIITIQAGGARYFSQQVDRSTMAKINYIPRAVFNREDFSSQVGSTTQFVLERVPIEGTVMVLRNGVETIEGGSSADYSLAGQTVTVNFPMFADRTSLVVKYFFQRSGG